MSTTIQRATEIIELIGQEPRTLSDIAQHFDVHRSTVLRQLQTLERTGFAIRRADGTYSIGTRIISIAHQFLEKLDLRKIAYEEIRSLHRSVGNTLHLAQLIEDSIVYIDKVEGGDGVRMYSRIGLPVRPDCTGVGKTILAQLEPPQREVVLRKSEAAVDRAALDVELSEIRERGWGVDDGEFEDFVNCVAAPITNSTGTIVGALSITAIKMVSSLDDLKQHLPKLRETTELISRQLG